MQESDFQIKLREAAQQSRRKLFQVLSTPLSPSAQAILAQQRLERRMLEDRILTQSPDSVSEGALSLKGIDLREPLRLSIELNALQSRILEQVSASVEPLEIAHTSAWRRETNAV